MDIVQACAPELQIASSPLCRLICKGRTVSFHGPLPPRAGTVPLQVRRLFCLRGQREKETIIVLEQRKRMEKMHIKE